MLTPWAVIGKGCGGGGVSKAKVSKGKYAAKLEFLRGGARTKKSSVGEVWVFSGTTQ